MRFRIQQLRNKVDLLFFILILCLLARKNRLVIPNLRRANSFFSLPTVPLYFLAPSSWQVVAPFPLHKSRYMGCHLAVNFKRSLRGRVKFALFIPITLKTWPHKKSSEASSFSAWTPINWLLPDFFGLCCGSGCWVVVLTALGCPCQHSMNFISFLVWSVLTDQCGNILLWATVNTYQPACLSSAIPPATYCSMSVQRGVYIALQLASDSSLL